MWLCWVARCSYGGDGTRAAPTGESGWWCAWAVGCWALGTGLDGRGGGFGGGFGGGVIERDCCGIEPTATMVDESL